MLLLGHARDRFEIFWSTQRLHGAVGRLEGESGTRETHLLAVDLERHLAVGVKAEQAPHFRGNRDLAALRHGGNDGFHLSHLNAKRHLYWLIAVHRSRTASHSG